jgi:hypothetical protein
VANLAHISVRWVDVRQSREALEKQRQDATTDDPPDQPGGFLFFLETDDADDSSQSVF